MATDEILDEIHRHREAYAAQFDYNLERMFEDLKAKEGVNPAKRADIVPLEPKPPQRL